MAFNGNGDRAGVDSTPAMQQAIVQTGLGGPEVLQLQSIPVLEPGPGQVLVRVVAASVNPGDWKFRTGSIFKELGPPPGGAPGGPPPGGPPGGPPQPKVPGGDVSGVIARLGPGVTAFQVGEPVIALLTVMGPAAIPMNGGYAQYVVASVDSVAAKPAALTYAEAAGLGRAGAMAGRLVSDAKVSPGQRVLIAGAGGGVGSVAVQIAKARGAQVIGVASARHGDFLKSLGADQHIDYADADWPKGAAGIDVGIDTVGGGSAAQVLAAVKPGGVFISVLPNPALTPETCAASGVNCLPAPAGGTDPYLASVVALAQAGKIKVQVDQAFPLAEAGQAQEASRAGHTQGKIIIVVDEALAHAR